MHIAFSNFIAHKMLVEDSEFANAVFRIEEVPQNSPFELAGKPVVQGVKTGRVEPQ